MNIGNNKNDYDAIQQAWLEAAKDLGLEIGYPFLLTDDNDEYPDLLLIRKFGSPKGTIIKNINASNLNQDFIEKQGYYYSYLHPIHYRKYDKKLFVETLIDWGWYGEVHKRPSWYKRTDQVTPENGPGHSEGTGQ